MRLSTVSAGIFVSIAALAGCDEPVSTHSPRGIEVVVAPLQLTGIAEACYDILIENGAGSSLGAQGGGNDVVARFAPGGAICSSDFGNGAAGDITYIAPCDATSDSDPTTPSPDIENAITVWPYLKDASGQAIDVATWRNPCDTTPGGTVEGCQLHVNCNENSDTLAAFNFTVMRDAQQGFFDVAVNFEDIFCSAKLDSCYGNGQTNDCSGGDIMLIHGAESAQRQHTAVLAFACTAGPGKQTDLLIGNPVVWCHETGTE